MADTTLKKPKVYKTYDDGYIVRQMMPEDTKIVQDWFVQLGSISRADLNITLSVYPPDAQGFYIGEYNGKVVASAIRIPWGDVFYGSYYFVDEKHRRKGYGTRLRDEVAREYVGENLLCIDAVLGKVTEDNLKKFGYKIGFKTGQYHTTAKENIVMYSGAIKNAMDVPFEDLIDYDNKNFIRPNVRERKEFLRKWIRIPNGASYVALDKSGKIVGLACRRSCIQEKTHNIGPLYADNLEIGNGLMQRLLDGIVGEEANINICYTNPDALKMLKTFDFHIGFDVQRMYINGDPGTLKNSVLAITSIDICGF